ncbi:MAG: WG repeat-containing protein [Candidatus Rifleibacteriota bacterium]
MACHAQDKNINFMGNRAYVTFSGIEDWEFQPFQVGEQFGFKTRSPRDGWETVEINGQTIVNPLFDNVCRFMHGYAPVKENGRWGIIDTTAQYVVSPEYEKVWQPFSETGGYTMQFSTDGVDTNLLYEVDQTLDWTNGLAPGIFPLMKDNRWFLVGSKNAVSEEQGFEDMGNMHFGRAAVRKGERWGFIDPDGSLAISARFDEVNSFSEDLAAVKFKNHWGYIDTSGKVIVHCQFDEAKPFASGTAIVVKDNRYGIIDRTGKFLLKPEYGMIIPTTAPGLLEVTKDFYSGIYHREKGLIIPVRYSFLTILAENLILADRGDSQGLFDFSGNSVLGLTEAEISSLGNSYMRVKNVTSLAVFDIGERKIIELDFADIRPFSDGRAAFMTKDAKWGFLDSSLRIAIFPNYLWVTDFKDRHAAVEDHKGIRIIDIRNNLVKDPYLTKIPIDGTDAFKKVCFQNKWGLQDKDGNWITKPEFLDLRVFSTGVALAWIGTYNWRLLTPEKAPNAEYQSYEDVGHISENRCWVRSQGYFGYLDEKGRLVIPMIYDSATEMRDRMAAVRKNFLWGFIDKDGNQVLPHIFSKVDYQYQNGTYLVYEGEKPGYVTRDGKFFPTEAETMPAEKPETSK